MPALGLGIAIVEPRIAKAGGGPGPSGPALLLENGFYLLLENGSYLLLG